MADFNLHRPDEPIFLARLHKGAESGVLHIRRPRSSKGWSYCGLRIEHNDRSGIRFANLEGLCKNCLRAFFEESFEIYCEKPIPDGWLRLWQKAQGVETLYQAPQDRPDATIRPVRDSLAGHARNALQTAQSYVELGTAELPPAEAFAAFVGMRDRLQCIVDRVQLLEDTLDGYDVSDLPAHVASRNIRRIIS